MELLYNTHSTDEVPHEPRPSPTLGVGPKLSTGHQLEVKAEVGGQALEEVQAVARPGRALLVSGGGRLRMCHPVRPWNCLESGDT